MLLIFAKGERVVKKDVLYIEITLTKLVSADSVQFGTIEIGKGLK